MLRTSRMDKPVSLEISGSVAPATAKRGVSLATLVAFAEDMFPGVSTKDIGVWPAGDGELVVSLRDGGTIRWNKGSTTPGRRDRGEIGALWSRLVSFTPMADEPSRAKMIALHAATCGTYSLQKLARSALICLAFVSEKLALALPRSSWRTM